MIHGPHATPDVWGISDPEKLGGSRGDINDVASMTNQAAEVLALAVGIVWFGQGCTTAAPGRGAMLQSCTVFAPSSWCRSEL
jgi:hypothetical protein